MKALIVTYYAYFSQTSCCNILVSNFFEKLAVRAKVQIVIIFQLQLISVS